MAVFGPNKRRKIPVPKRHGVRDPLKKLAEREAAIKDKINNPPKERDVQEVSNRFKQFVQLKEQTKNHTLNKPNQPRPKRKRKRATLQVGNSVVQQLPKESEEAFLQRASKVQQDRVVEAGFASKYNAEVERDESTGAIKLKKKKAYEIDELLKRKSEDAKGRKRKKNKQTEEKKKPTLADKKALKKKKLEEKRRKEEDKLLEEYQLDTVRFGEVVHEPPTLNTKPRHAEKLNGAPRPGQKRLLLHSLLNQSKDEDEDQAEPQRKKAKKTDTTLKVDLKGKRKKLPAATRVKIEREQQNVIEMYRQMKKAKYVE